LISLQICHACFSYLLFALLNFYLFTTGSQSASQRHINKPIPKPLPLNLREGAGEGLNIYGKKSFNLKGSQRLLLSNTKGYNKLRVFYEYKKINRFGSKSNFFCSFSLNIELLMLRTSIFNIFPEIYTGGRQKIHRTKQIASGIRH
jgi:hypothetical protein